MYRLTAVKRTIAEIPLMMPIIVGSFSLSSVLNSTERYTIYPEDFVGMVTCA